MCNKENNLNSVLDSFQGVTEIKDEKEKVLSQLCGNTEDSHHPWFVKRP